MIVPAGVPHWHKEVPKSIVYYTVKVPKTPGTTGTEAVYVSHEKGSPDVREARSR